MSWSFFVKLFSSCDLFIHPFVPSFIHGWHHIGKKTLAKIHNPLTFPSTHVLLSRKGRPGPGGTPKILISISATNPTYILTKNYIYGFQIAFISKT